MSDGDGFRQKALHAMERAAKATDLATSQEFAKLAASYLKLADDADGLQRPATRYPNHQHPD